MTVNNVTGSTVSLEEATQKRSAAGKTASQLNADTFMSMLLAEMRNQNPFEPMKDNEMMSQLAQVTSTQEMQKMTATLQEVNLTNQLLSASSMIGKLVSYQDDAGGSIEAKVSTVVVENNKVMLTAGSNKIKLTDITQIRDSE
jgi:flagellar basal-body rod modification protein FlgD